jgi:hypothetical protein
MTDRPFDNAHHGCEHWWERPDQVWVGTAAAVTLAAYCFAMYCVAHNAAFL